MSNQSTKTSSRIAYLWTSFDSRGFRALRAALSSAPSLARLRVASFSDGITALFRLDFRAGDADAEALREWALRNGIEMVDASSWLAVQRQQVATALLRFRCRYERRVLDGAILDLADHLEQAIALHEQLSTGRTATLLGIPVSSTGACCSTLRTAISRHIQNSDGVPAQVIARETQAWWGQRTRDKTARVVIAR